MTVFPGEASNFSRFDENSKKVGKFSGNYRGKLPHNLLGVGKSLGVLRSGHRVEKWEVARKLRVREGKINKTLRLLLFGSDWPAKKCTAPFEFCFYSYWKLVGVFRAFSEENIEIITRPREVFG